MVAVAISQSTQRKRRWAPDYSGDQLELRTDSDAGGTEAVALHTARSVADTHTRDRCARHRRSGIARSNACCSSVSAASCRPFPQAPDDNVCLYGNEQKHLHSRIFAAALTALKRSSQVMSILGMSSSSYEVLNTMLL